MRVMPSKERGSDAGLATSACDFFAHGFFVSDRINRMDNMTSENIDGENSVDSVHSVENRCKLAKDLR